MKNLSKALLLFRPGDIIFYRAANSDGHNNGLNLMHKFRPYIVISATDSELVALPMTTNTNPLYTKWGINIGPIEPNAESTSTVVLTAPIVINIYGRRIDSIRRHEYSLSPEATKELLYAFITYLVSGFLSETDIVDIGEKILNVLDMRSNTFKFSKDTYDIGEWKFSDIAEDVSDSETESESKAKELDDTDTDTVTTVTGLTGLTICELLNTFNISRTEFYAYKNKGLIIPYKDPADRRRYRYTDENGTLEFKGLKDAISIHEKEMKEQLRSKAKVEEKTVTKKKQAVEDDAATTSSPEQPSIINITNRAKLFSSLFIVDKASTMSAVEAASHFKNVTKNNMSWPEAKGILCNHMLTKQYGLSDYISIGGAFRLKKKSELKDSEKTEKYLDEMRQDINVYGKEFATRKWGEIINKI